MGCFNCPSLPAGSLHPPVSHSLSTHYRPENFLSPSLITREAYIFFCYLFDQTENLPHGPARLSSGEHPGQHGRLFGRPQRPSRCGVRGAAQQFVRPLCFPARPLGENGQVLIFGVRFLLRFDISKVYRDFFSGRPTLMNSC